MSSRTVLGAIAAAAVFVLSGCSGLSGVRDTSGDRQSESSIHMGWVQPVALKYPVPEFAELEPMDSIGGHAWPSHGTVVVAFWASYCGPCRHELPWLDRLSNTQDIRVVGVSRDVQVGAAEALLADLDIKFGNYWDPHGDYAAKLARVVPPNAIPSLVVVVNGEVAGIHVGAFSSYAQLQRGVVSQLRPA